MKRIVCEMCEGTEFIKKDGVYECMSCGVKYTLEEARKMMVEVGDTACAAESRPAEITSEPAVKRNSEEVENLYRLARRAKETDNSENAQKYYEMLLLKDSESWEANFYSVYYKSKSCTIAQITTAIGNVENCIEPTFRLIVNNVKDELDRYFAVKEVVERTQEIAEMMRIAYENHYNGIERSIKANFLSQYLSVTLAVSTAKCKPFVCLMNMLEDDEYIMLNYGCRELEKFLVGREDWHYAGKARSIIRRYKQIIDKEERERAEKQAREEQEKRDAYWAEHSSEKAALEAELQEIESRITVLNEEIEYNTKVIEPKIAELVKKRKNELPEEKEFLKQKKLVLELEALRTRNNMNLFKMKENKELATRLDTVEYPKLSSLRESSKKAREDYLKSIDKEIDALKNENIKERKREIKNLEARKNEIINELTKNR